MQKKPVAEPLAVTFSDGRGQVGVLVGDQEIYSGTRRGAQALVKAINANAEKWLAERVRLGCTPLRFKTGDVLAMPGEAFMAGVVRRRLASLNGQPVFTLESHWTRLPPKAARASSKAKPRKRGKE